MILCHEVPPRLSEGDVAYEVNYVTPKRRGKQRFGGHRARDKANTFSLEILAELLANGQILSESLDRKRLAW